MSAVHVFRTLQMLKPLSLRPLLALDKGGLSLSRQLGIFWSAKRRRRQIKVTVIDQPNSDEPPVRIYLCPLSPLGLGARAALVDQVQVLRTE